MTERKISIVTVVYNGEKYIERCMKSIMSQNYSNYEHIIIDGKSTDRTMDIVKSYADQYPVQYISEKDNGMYDAIMKGFSMAKGEIMAWLNADDTYLPWAFQAMNYAASTGKEWFTCVNSWQNDHDIVYHTGDTYVYEQRLIGEDYYTGRLLPFIQQESTFWTRSIWEKANFDLSRYKLAGDYHLWKEFSKHSPLYTVSTVIASFRVHIGQKSGDIEEYYREAALKRHSRISVKINLFRNKIFRRYHRNEFIIDLPKVIE